MMLKFFEIADRNFIDIKRVYKLNTTGPSCPVGITKTKRLQYMQRKTQQY